MLRSLLNVKINVCILRSVRNYSNTRKVIASSSSNKSKFFQRNCVQPKMKFIEIGVNLSDRMYQGEYNGSKKHEADLSCVLDRAWKSGIESMIITGGSLSDSSQAIELSKQENRLFATVGCHPTRCNEFLKPDDGAELDDSSLMSTEDYSLTYLNSLKKLIQNNKGKVVAIGECGLDYDRLHFCPKDIQKKYFERQLELASSTQLPLFLHCRSAANDLIEILTRNCDILPRNKGVIHSFDGSYEEARQFMELGFSIGINGCSLKTEENLAVVRQIPNDKLMIETDAPWCDIRLTHASAKFLDQCNAVPSVKKEKWKPGVMIKGRNEPCNIRYVLDAIAGIKAEPENIDEYKKDLADQIYNNTKSVFFPAS